MNIGDELLAKIEGALKEGLTFPEALEQAVAWAKQHERAITLIQEFGREWFGYFYRHHQFLRAPYPTHGKIDHLLEQRTARVQSSVINQKFAIFEIRELVGGRWKRLGDLSAADLDWLAKEKTRESRHAAGAAKVYTEIAKHVRTAGRGKTVQQALSVEQLQKIYRDMPED